MAKKEIKLNDLDGVTGGVLPTAVPGGNNPGNGNPGNSKPNSNCNSIVPNKKKVDILKVDRASDK